MPILYYHNVVAEPPDALEFCRLLVDGFAREARTLAEHFEVVSLPRFLDGVRHGRNEPKTVVLTFDDAYRGVYDHAFPVLRELGLTATVFVITDTLLGGEEPPLLHHEEVEAALRLSRAEALHFELAEGGPHLPLGSLGERRHALRQLKRVFKVLPDAERARWQERVLSRLEVSPADCLAAVRERTPRRFMGREELAELRDAGWTLGSHTCSHRTLSRLEDGDLRREIMGSRSILQEDLGLDDMPFAYPFGHPEHIGDRAPQLAAEAGYTCAVAACDPGDGVSDLFRLPRINFESLRTAFNMA